MLFAAAFQKHRFPNAAIRGDWFKKRLTTDHRRDELPIPSDVTLERKTKRSNVSGDRESV